MWFSNLTPRTFRGAPVKKDTLYLSCYLYFVRLGGFWIWLGFGSKTGSLWDWYLEFWSIGILHHSATGHWYPFRHIYKLVCDGELPVQCAHLESWTQIWCRNGRNAVIPRLSSYKCYVEIGAMQWSYKCEGARPYSHHWLIYHCIPPDHPDCHAGNPDEIRQISQILPALTTNITRIYNNYYQRWWQIIPALMTNITSGNNHN